MQPFILPSQFYVTSHLHCYICESVILSTDFWCDHLLYQMDTDQIFIIILYWQGTIKSKNTLSNNNFALLPNVCPSNPSTVAIWLELFELEFTVSFHESWNTNFRRHVRAPRCSSFDHPLTGSLTLSYLTVKMHWYIVNWQFYESIQSKLSE